MKQTLPSDDAQGYHSIAELAQITNESVAVWRKRIFFRQIAYTKCGKNVRVSHQTLQDWLRARTVQAATLSNGGHEAEAR